MLRLCLGAFSYGTDMLAYGLVFWSQSYLSKVTSYTWEDKSIVDDSLLVPCHIKSQDNSLWVYRKT